MTNALSNNSTGAAGCNRVCVALAYSIAALVFISRLKAGAFMEWHEWQLGTQHVRTALWPTHVRKVSYDADSCDKHRFGNLANA